MENMDLEEDRDSRIEQTPTNCKRQGRQKFTKVSQRTQKHSRNKNSGKTDSRLRKAKVTSCNVKSAQNQKGREAQPRCRKQLNMDCVLDLHTLIDQGAGGEALPSSEPLINAPDEEDHDDNRSFEGFMVYYKQTVSELEQLLTSEDLHSPTVMDTVAHMWQELSAEEQQAFVTMAAVEAGSQDSIGHDLSEDLRDVSISPIRELNNDSSSSSLDKALQELLDSVVNSESESPEHPINDVTSSSSISPSEALGSTFKNLTTADESSLDQYLPLSFSDLITTDPAVIQPTEEYVKQEGMDDDISAQDHSVVPFNLDIYLTDQVGDSLSQQVVPSEMELSMQPEGMSEGNKESTVPCPLSPNWKSNNTSVPSLQRISANRSPTFWLTSENLLDSC